MLAKKSNSNADDCCYYSLDLGSGIGGATTPVSKPLPFLPLCSQRGVFWSGLSRREGEWQALCGEVHPEEGAERQGKQHRERDSSSEKVSNPGGGTASFSSHLWIVGSQSRGRICSQELVAQRQSKRVIRALEGVCCVNDDWCSYVAFRAFCICSKILICEYNLFQKYACNPKPLYTKVNFKNHWLSRDHGTFSVTYDSYCKTLLVYQVTIY